MAVSRRKLEATSWLAVIRAYQECQRRYSQLMAGFGLTIPQFDALNAIARLGIDATPKAIAAELVVTRGNVTGVLHRLEEARLIRTRANATDGRSFVCVLTRAGSRRLDRARRAAALFIREQLAPFDDADLTRTETQMATMRAHLMTIDPDEIAARVAAT
jgi:DNA-binding MarR family transcriptional regulator